MSKLYPILLGLMLGTSGPAATSTISLTEVQRVRLAKLATSQPEVKKLYGKLKREADAALDEPGHPVAQLQTTGRLESDPAKARTRSSLEDMKRLQALGYTYAVSANDAYAAAARRIITRWAEVNQPTGLPVDETKFEPLIVTYDLVRATFAQGERQKVEDWLRKIATREKDGARTQSITARNNWNSHRLKLVGLIGFALDDKGLVETAVAGYRKQIEENLEPDGSSLDFHQRDALHYHCYDLEPLLTLAMAAAQNGIDLYHYEAAGGGSLPKGVAFLAPYCEGTKTHAEWVHSKVAFDRERAAAGEKKFTIGVAFEPKDGRRVFELAAFFEEHYRGLAARLSGKPGAKYASWQGVLNEVRR